MILLHELGGGFLAVLPKQDPPLSLDLGDLLQKLLGVPLPDVLKEPITPEWAVFACAPGGPIIFGLAIESDLDLSTIPVVGDKLPGMTDPIGLGLGVLYVANADPHLTADSDLWKELKKEVPDLPEEVPQNGFHLSATIKVPGLKEETLSVPLSSGSPPPDQKRAKDVAKRRQITPDPGSKDKSPGLTKWFNLNKTIGPLTVKAIGLSYVESKAKFMINASLAISGLEMDVQGLSVSSPITKFRPKIGLDGLGIQYACSDMEVGGAFLKSGDDYAGAVTARFETFALGALGAYSDKDKSLFIYGFLDAPIGGEPYLFVDGLAGGFGFNRRLTMPPIAEVYRFPFVSEATGVSPPGQTLEGELKTLATYVAPELGEYWLAVGVKFSSFKQIESFVLLTASFGKTFELDVLGLSTLKVPSEGPEQLAVVQLEILARFAPEEGVLGVQGQLTPQSWILSKNCHLQGGFAFQAWFTGDHAGEFVVTLGGYHPKFDVPKFYPRVPRVGFKWQVDSRTQITGQLYYALTPSAFMAGGNLRVTWASGSTRAWFTMGADFMIGWLPFHYEASAHVDIGAEVTIHTFFGTHHIQADVGADVEIHGPEFGGHAHLKVFVVSFTVNFGAPRFPPKPVPWCDFVKSFLPSNKEKKCTPCTLAVTRGLIRTLKGAGASGGDHWVVNAKEVSFAAASAIPSTKHAPCTSDDCLEQPPAVAPAPVGHPDFLSQLTVNVTRTDHVQVPFKLRPIFKNVPAALWDPKAPVGPPKPDGRPMIPGALTGYVIEPAEPPTSDGTAWVQDGHLRYEVSSPDPPLPEHAASVTYTIKAETKTWEGPSQDWLHALGLRKERPNLGSLSFVLPPVTATAEGSA